ncbi:potassium channel family protein [Halapricum hydrolyticum]|uniref:TrkA C-terminal domain-containing protein n=1 Tax=Halapricum hydrolyticum TaxID=2979991 RepID=A0AAE3IAA6_9EURY|nr:TrkA C-terminal domain-containing protein [Halapricum hydrolyticum]MCU4718440.1 TrkA C-terminal domain-containing protein [Halapricum hydrolyticum]MCU4726447.1 TrkA C-terminal domain-containing protein [Halapricum hydrolyticum]
MDSLPIAIVYGLYLGVLTGIIPALVSGVLGFLFKYVTGVTLPGFGVVVLAVALAGINGGLLALADPTILASANAPTVTTGLLIVMMMSLYAHAKGDQLGASVPRRLSLRALGERTLSADLVEVVGGRNEVRIRVTGDVADIEGYPPLPEHLRAAIRDSDWRLPADLQVSELETRLAERLRTEFELGDVSVSIDKSGGASVAAAPPFSGLSRRLDGNQRAVSVNALVPTGLARGDSVTAVTPEERVRGEVVSASSTRPGSDEEAPPPIEGGQVVAETPAEPAPARAPTTSGGDGQVTLAVARSDVETLLRADGATVIVESRGVRREYEVLSLLRRAGKRFRRLTVRPGSELDGVTLAGANVRGRYEVAVLAVRTGGGWQFSPKGTRQLAAGDELFAVGSGDALDRFGEVVT